MKFDEFLQAMHDRKQGRSQNVNSMLVKSPHKQLRLVPIESLSAEQRARIKPRGGKKTKRERKNVWIEA